MTIRFALLLAAVAFPVSAHAGGFADLAAVDREVAAFTGAPQGLPGGAVRPVDRRLKLVPCSAPLNLRWYNSQRDSVVVQCPTPDGWRLFVPVMAVQGAAAQNAISRGDVVTVAISGDGFTVSQPGEALEAGALGAWIRVRTVSDGTSKGEPMRAQVVRPGLVEVPVP
jgi:flagellar basal body P-ring formation protein FlgA